MSSSRARFLSVIFLLTTLSGGLVFAQQNNLSETKGRQISEDIYKAGGSVKLSTDVEGDAVVAGGILSIANSVSEDLLAAGGVVNITANIGGDIRSAGGSVSIGGNVGSDVVAAGGFVTLESTSTVGGQAWLAGGIVNVAGNVTQDLKATGRQVTLTGTVGGDVEIHADSIDIEPGAVIKGKLIYSAPRELVVNEGVIIDGAIERQEFALGNIETWGEAFAGSLKFYLSLALSAILIFFLYPRFSAKVVERLDEALLQSLGLGFVVLVMTPVITILLLVTGLGAPLGLISLAVYLATLIVGLLLGIIWIGDAGFRLLGQTPGRSKWTRVWSIVAAAAALLLVKFIPYIGGWVFFITLLLGMGAMKMYFYRLYVGQRS
jgi:cytoskeletal protein CcmA (bactofilin family)